MTKDEALRLALYALEIEQRMYEATDPETGTPYNIIEAIKACEAALAQPEQDPPYDMLKKEFDILFDRHTELIGQMGAIAKSKEKNT